MLNYYSEVMHKLMPDEDKSIYLVLIQNTLVPGDEKESAVLKQMKEIALKFIEKSIANLENEEDSDFEITKLLKQKEKIKNISTNVQY